MKCDWEAEKRSLNWKSVRLIENAFVYLGKAFADFFKKYPNALWRRKSSNFANLCNRRRNRRCGIRERVRVLKFEVEIWGKLMRERVRTHRERTANAAKLSRNCTGERLNVGVDVGLRVVVLGVAGRWRVGCFGPCEWAR